MKTIVIIQARMGSTRLSGKILLPLSTSVVLDYVVKRCQYIRGVERVIVATSTLPGDDAVVQWCQESKVDYYRGSEEDVLSRYYECAQLYEPDYVIRVTADCPFIDFELAEGIISVMQQSPADIVKVHGELPRGLVVEMLSYATLERLHQIGLEPRHREHVTYFASEYPELFKFVDYDADKFLCEPALRVTLDTHEDYELCKAVADYFLGDLLVSSSKVIAYLLEHPEVAKLNAHIEQKPVV